MLDATRRADTGDGWRIAEFIVDGRREQVSRQGEILDIDRSGFALLRCLVLHAPDVVDKKTLFAAGWPDRVVSDNSLPKAISKLRRSLGDSQSELIVAVHGYGYRLGADVVPWTRPVETEPSESSPAPATQAAEPAVSVDAPRKTRSAWRWIAGVAAAILALGFVSTQLPSRETQPARLSTASLPRIAAVPFRDLSGDGSLALLSRGIAEHLRQDAHRVPGLLIADPGPAQQFQEDSTNAAEIGAALAANIVLGGDISKVDGRLRVELRITDLRGVIAPTRRVFEREATDHATLFDDLTLAMFQALSPQPGQFGLAPGRGGGTANPEAYLAFLRASTVFVNNNDPTSQRRAIAALEHAVALDPDYADAMLMLGGVLGGSGYFADTPEELRAGRQRALAMMDRGIALTPNDPWNYLLRSEMRLLYRFDWAGAWADIQAAEAIPSDDAAAAMILIWKARFIASMNRIDDAIAIGSQANAIAPDAGGRRNQGWHYLAKGDLRSARAVLKLQLQNYPESPHVHFYLALCDILEGQPSSALAQLEYSSPMFRLTGTAVAQFELGNRDASDTALTALKNRFTPADGYWAAAVHAWRGEADDAFAWLDYAQRAGDSSLMYLPFDPHWRKLRNDPRMQAWITRLAPPADLLTTAR